MNAYNLLVNPENGVLKLINANHPDLFIYDSMGYELQKIGSKGECHEAAHEYWEENYVPDEKRILND